MKSVAFLSMDSLAGFVSDDELAIPALNSLGWNVETVSWRQRRDWSDFDLVIMRTTWDYHHHVNDFLDVLYAINSPKGRLQNCIELVRWNLEKTYLRDLQERGNRIVPTLWGDPGRLPDVVEASFATFGVDEIIVKPVVSANADNTFRVRKKEYRHVLAVMQTVFDKRAFLIQPFMPHIIEEGEYSLFYFGGKYSHAILKTPKMHDFRVQEEHGGVITAVHPGHELMRAGLRALQSLPVEALYARADFVRDSLGQFAIMEVELIEPALYFRMNPESPKKFAEAVDRWYRHQLQS